MRVLIVGCGYVGMPLAISLARQGHDVFGLRRSQTPASELTASGITPLAADITRVEDLARLPEPFDWVINTVSSSKGGAEEYRQVYLQGTRNLLECFRRGSPQKYVYTSSTSVYGQTDGSSVTEASPTAPESATSRVLVETEQFLLGAWQRQSFPAIILRVAGIYGPERGHLFHQFLRREARMSGTGQRIINMVHREDLVRALVAALERGQSGQVYNVVDDEPVTEREFFGWLASQLGQPMPPEQFDAAQSKRKRGLTNKRVSNEKLKRELCCGLQYPTFREGYAAEIKRLKGCGLLVS